MIDRGAAVPLYHQIFLQLRDEILSGQRPLGSAMPTEQDLSDSYGVSRITARRVLGELAKQHYVERRRRLGTRVIFEPPALPMEANIDQAVDTLLAFGRRTTVKVVDVRQEAASPSVADALRLKKSSQVVRAVRVRSMSEEPLGYIVSYVPADLGEHVTPDKLEKAPILKLLADAGWLAEHADQTIGAVEADGTISQALGIEARAALLRISRVSFDREHRPFLLTHAHYRADRFTIRLDLQHGRGATGPQMELEVGGAPRGAGRRK